MATRHLSVEVNKDRFVIPEETMSNDPFSKTPYPVSGYEESPVLLSDSSPTFIINPSSFEFINEESEQTSFKTDKNQRDVPTTAIELKVEYIEDSNPSHLKNDEEHLEHHIVSHSHKPISISQSHSLLRALPPKTVKFQSPDTEYDNTELIPEDSQTINPDEPILSSEDRNRARKTIVEFCFDEIMGQGYEEKGSFHTIPKIQPQFKGKESTAAESNFKRKPKIQVRISEHETTTLSPLIEPIKSSSISFTDTKSAYSDEESTVEAVSSSHDAESKYSILVDSKQTSDNTHLNNPNLPAPAPKGELMTPSLEESKEKVTQPMTSSQAPMVKMTGTPPPVENRPKENAKIQEIRDDRRCGRCNIF